MSAQTGADATFDGASIRAIQDLRRWAECGDGSFSFVELPVSPPQVPHAN